MTTKETTIINNDLLINNNPYLNTDKDSLGASIGLLSFGSRFHKIDKKISKEEVDVFFPIMKDSIEFVNKILNVNRKQISNDLVIEHKTLRSDLHHTLNNGEEKIDILNNIRDLINEDYSKLICFIQNRLTYYKKNSNKYNHKVGYISLTSYLERELDYRRSKNFYNHEVAITLLKTITDKSSSFQDDIVRDLLAEYLKMFKQGNKKEQVYITKMCNALKKS